MARSAVRIVAGNAALMLVAIAGWDFVLLARTPAWLRWTMLIGAVTVAAALLFRRDYVGRATVALCVAGLLFALGDTAAYTVHAVMDYRGGAVAADNRALDALLVGTDNRWAAATVGSQNAASLELNTGKSVMAIGGFSGADNWPTLDQFKGYAADGQIRYFIGASSASGAAGQISSWVAANFVQQRIGDVTVYDLAC